MIRAIPRLALGAALVLAGSGVAGADEAKTPVSAAMILSIVSAPVQPKTSAFDESLKRPASTTSESTDGEVLSDGSVRYGRAVVTVKNPCPPGTAHWEPPPLPGRRGGGFAGVSPSSRR